MSYAVKRVQKFAASPDHPQTATVYDFACLFTHDLKRKAKRWQDGKLKYHTFNKKIVVYDDRGHFVGDAHWDGDEDVVEGDELELDRGGVMVQVADCKGEREQDLTEVLDKRAREVEKRRQQAAAKAPRQSNNHAAAAAARRQQYLPLSGLLQTPGPIGRAAIPDRSPFEARRQVLSHIGEPRETPQKSGAPPAKKRRLSPSPPSKAGFAQSLFGTKLSLSATPSAELLAARARALRERTNLQESRELEAQEATRPAIKKSVLKGFQPSTLRAMGMSAEEPVQIEEESESEEELDRTSRYFEERPKAKQRVRDFHSSDKPSIQSARNLVTEQKRDSQAATSSPQQTSPPTRVERQAPRMSKASMKRVPSFDVPDTTPSPPRTKIRKQQPDRVSERSPSPPPKSKTPKKKPMVLPSRSTSPSPVRPPSPPPKTNIARQRSEVFERDSGKQARKEAKEKRRASRAEAKAQRKDSETQEVREKERPPRDEPRTELRIRARKRRGLLMMNETLPPAPPREPSPGAPPAKRAKSPELHSRNVSPPSPRRRLKRASPEVEPESVRELSDEPAVIDVQPSPKPSTPIQQPVTAVKKPELEVPSSPVTEVIPSSPHKKKCKSTNAAFDKFEDSEDIYTASIPSTAPGPESKAELPVVEQPSDKAEASQDTYNVSIPSTMPEDKADILMPEPVVERLQECQDIESASILPSASKPEANILASEYAANKATSIVALDSSPAKSEAALPGPKVVEPSKLETPTAPSVEPPAEPISDAEEGSPLPKRRNLRRKVSKPSKMYTIDSADDVEAMQDEPESQAEESEQVEAPAHPPPAAPQGPRIARMARKSVKSREIFGFVPETIPAIMPMQFATATIQLGNWKDVKIDTESKAAEITPQVSEPPESKQCRNEAGVRLESEAKENLPVPREAPKSENENKAPRAAKTTAETPVVVIKKQDASHVPPPMSKLAKDDISPEPTTIDGATRPRIVNPATRGKKAARKEDAAGKVPQTFVPFEPPRIIPRIAVKPQPEPRRTERPCVALPNFAAASGGAWSIHAHDLLGIARPSKRQK